MPFTNRENEGRERKNTSGTELTRGITKEEHGYKQFGMIHGITDIKYQSSKNDTLKLNHKQNNEYEIIQDEMKEKSSPDSASKAFRPKFHLLKQPKKMRSAITKKRKFPGVLNVSLTLQFSEKCHCDHDVIIEKRENTKVNVPNQCPTPSNSPSSPSTIDDDAINFIYCHLEEDTIFGHFDKSLDDSLDSCRSDYGLGINATNDEERMREYWKFCYGDQTVEMKHTESVQNISKVKPTKSCIPIRQGRMELESKKKVQFGNNTVFEFDPCFSQPNSRMD